ncbi:AAA family ATPase [Micromonospora sp. R77]|uniref:ATP-binding protein n=1 Tax=Micromonospora sp. R77 TaxID=2925836 RepID=UPI001F625C51|nr:helix-turn-helix transcriptional regulator [Micromonospora sp. R77]MCI4061295.1 AAA family ATPase [Micromonospora sp. R77]
MASGQRDARPAPPPIMGRTGECQVLRDALRRAAAGRAQVVAIGGEPGIGKTRLAREGLAIAEASGFTVLASAAGPLDRDLSLAPVVEALRPLVDGGTTLGQGLTDLARLFDGLGVPAPADLGDPGLERTRLFEAVRRLVDRSARRAPVAWLLDDVHWADAATLGLVQYLVRGLDERPFLLLLTHRAEVQGTSAGQMLAALRRTAEFTALDLHGLAAGDVAAITETLVGGVVPQTLTDLLVERSGGVPLFVTEIVGALLASGALRRVADQWVLDRALDVPVPAAVAELMGNRISGLPDAAHAVMDLLAVSPGAIPHVLLASVLDEHRALDGVTGLLSSGLIFEEEGPDGVAYRASHPLLAEVAHDRLPTVTRRRLHTALARAVKASMPRDTSRMARHVRGAGSELPPEEALDVLVPAAAEALRRRAGEEAAADAQAALDRLDAGDERRAGLLDTLAVASEIIGDFPAALTAWSRAASAGPPGPERAHRLRRAALSDWNVGRFDEAWQRLADAEGQLTGVAVGPHHIALQETRTTLAGRVDDARLAVELDRLGALVRATGSGKARLMELYARITLMIRRGQLEAAVPAVRELYASADATGDDVLREHVRRPGGQVAFIRGDLATAERDSLDGLRLAARLGVPTLGGVYLLYLGFIAQLRGDVAAEARWLARFSDLDLGGRFQRGVLIRQAIRGLGMVRRGRAEEGLALVAAIRSEHGHWAQGDRHAFSPIEYVECLALLQSGDATCARARAEESLSAGSALLGGCLQVLAEACLLDGDVPAARQALSRLREVGPGSPWPAASVRRVEGLLHATTGDPEAARAALSGAADLYAALGYRLEEATTRLDAATRALDAGTADAATGEAVRAALATAERIEAGHEVDRARALLRRLGVRTTRARPAAGPLDLSPREEEVARLVAEGLSNAEVSRRLFISPRTVTTHLQNIYVRLGVSSRTALTRYVLDRIGDT